MLLTHRCTTLSTFLSTLFKDLACIHRAKSSLMLKRTGDRMQPCRTSISCSCSSDRVEPSLALNERSGRKLWINTDMAPETSIPEVCQNAVFPRRVVGLFKVKENSENVLFVHKGVSNQFQNERGYPMFFLKPHCFCGESRPCDSRDHTRWEVIILVNAMGLTFLGSKWSLAGFGMGITTASRHDGGKQTGEVTTLEKTDNAEFRRWVKVNKYINRTNSAMKSY